MGGKQLHISFAESKVTAFLIQKTDLPYFCAVNLKLIISAIADYHNLMLYKNRK